MCLLGVTLSQYYAPLVFMKFARLPRGCNSSPASPAAFNSVQSHETQNMNIRLFGAFVLLL